MFARWGRFIYRFRWATLASSTLLLGLSVFGVLTGRELAGNGGFGADLEAGRTANLIAREIHFEPAAVSSGMTLIFSSSTLRVTDPAFEVALGDAVAPLQRDSRVSGVTTPYSVPASQQAGLISRDGRRALVMVEFKDASSKSQRYVNEIVAEVNPGPLAAVATGQVPINLAFNSTLDSDLLRAEYVAVPVTLLMLILIFAAVIAALLRGLDC